MDYSTGSNDGQMVCRIARRAVLCVLIAGGACTVTSAQAVLNALSDQALSQVDGQATGVNLALNLQINQTTPGVTNSSCAAGNAAGLPFCRLGIQINNVANWLLLKGVNGTINIPQLSLYGADLADPTVNSGTAIKQSAIAIGVVFPTAGNANNTAVQFRNVNYTLALSKNNTQYNYSGSTPTAPSAADNQAAYYAYSTLSAAQDPTNPTPGTLRETGIMRMVMNGNLNVGGQLYVFSK